VEFISVRTEDNCLLTT